MAVAVGSRLLWPGSHFGQPLKMLQIILLRVIPKELLFFWLNVDSAARPMVEPVLCKPSFAKVAAFFCRLPFCQRSGLKVLAICCSSSFTTGNALISGTCQDVFLFLCNYLSTKYTRVVLHFVYRLTTTLSSKYCPNSEQCICGSSRGSPTLIDLETFPSKYHSKTYKYIVGQSLCFTCGHGDM